MKKINDANQFHFVDLNSPKDIVRVPLNVDIPFPSEDLDIEAMFKPKRNKERNRFKSPNKCERWRKEPQHVKEHYENLAKTAKIIFNDKYNTTNNFIDSKTDFSFSSTNNSIDSTTDSFFSSTNISIDLTTDSSFSSINNFIDSTANSSLSSTKNRNVEKANTPLKKASRYKPTKNLYHHLHSTRNHR
ncbi:12159_t:CDS:2 [Ambispora gerdemannii]|uniref:12159_t:CDS:1 n=1 Tax=Ambispora gerdemannii TaxID=144530 RepID=A0A9N8Z668_9GLOM|nr:12159_t:CDS:2 [Ambispora gerdemannii]